MTRYEKKGTKNITRMICLGFMYDKCSIIIEYPEMYEQKELDIPIGSMYGICTYIYPKNGPNVGKYSIHGAYGIFFPTRNLHG